MRLHGIWVIKDDVEGELFLWAERIQPAFCTKKKTRTHPYSLCANEILEALKITGDPHQQTLLLPSYPSMPVSSHLTEIDIDATPSLKEWKVEGVVVKDTLNFLIFLDENELRDEKILLGEDLVFLSKVARFGLSLLTKQRFLPELRFIGKKLICLWQPVFISDEEKQAFSHLKSSIPDAVRCANKSSDDNYGTGKRKQASIPDAVRCANKASSKEGFVRDILTTLINQTIKSSIDYDLRAFFGGEGHSEEPCVLDVPRKELLHTQFKEWSSPLRIGPKEKGFRTCFRLEAPDDNNKPWYLRLLLQAEEDPSLFLDVHDIWKEKKRAVIPEIKEVINTLFTDLGVAMRLFPAIEKALSSARPHSLELNTTEAYSFLQEASLLLAECGFGVFVPSFWDMKRRKGATVGATIKAISPDTDAGLGLSQLMKFDWQIAVGDSVISKEEFESLVKLKIPLINIRGQWVEFQQGDVEGLLKYLKTKKKLSLAELMRLSLGGGEGDLLFSQVSAEGWMGELLESLKGNLQFTDLPQPAKFIGDLRPYQIRGLSWMNYMNGFGLGACLADDMGLGKTIQFIALLLHQREQGLAGKSLLVCPTSVLGNWERELARFAPELSCLIHHGQDRLKGKKLIKKVKVADVILTSFSLVHRDIESFKEIGFRYVVVDEAQNIKNPYTKQAQAVRSIKCDSRIALTGTPIENRLSELWSIMEFLNPGYLKTINEFKREFALPIERYGDTEAEKRLKRLISPFILRRLKQDPRIITDLPEKIEAKTFCPLTKEQATLYQATVEDMLKNIEEKEGIERKGCVLALLMKLKQICNHPALFLHDKSKLIDRSGKLERLKEMLTEMLEEGDHALIFTQFAEMGQMLKGYLEDTFLEEVLFLYGGTSRKKREEMIDRFQKENGPKLFILSLKAGGLGLNLTRANRVFHFDRWWNPAVENQATDRAFRIGQKQNVMVHKFLCQGTVEERIDEMLEKKKDLADRIVGAGEAWITELSTTKLRELFTLRKEAVME